MIVITILAILAGLVFPHWTNSSEVARVSSLVGDLQILRQQLMAYEADHTRYPQLNQMWANLTGITDDAGTITGVEGRRMHGPYLVDPPVNPFTGGSACAADNQADWEYDQATGRLRAVVPADIIARRGLASSDVVAAP